MLISESSFGGVSSRPIFNVAVFLDPLFATLSSELLCFRRSSGETMEHVRDRLVLWESAAEAEYISDELIVRELPERAFLSEDVPLGNNEWLETVVVLPAASFSNECFSLRVVCSGILIVMEKIDYARTETRRLYIE